MNSFSIADELDQAVNNVLGGMETVAVNTELEIGELVAIASELRDLPEPGFKAQLKAQFTGTIVPVLPVGMMSTASRAKREVEIPASILPTLRGIGTEGYPIHQRSLAASVFVHVTALALIVVSGVWAARKQMTPKAVVQSTVLYLADYPLPATPSEGRGGGGGGVDDKLKSSAGVPPPFTAEQFAPPQVVVRNEHPRLPVDSTVIGPPEVKFPQMPTGDLYSKLLPPSDGSGFGGGIGEGRGTGVGTGTGVGVGSGDVAGIGGGKYKGGGGVSAPRPLYDPEPEYSNEAREAKFQGSVVLWVVVGADGVPHDIRVQRSLGMGLDEKAIAAVHNWRFQPAMRNGQPVAVQVSIEVNFRLF